MATSSALLSRQQAAAPAVVRLLVTRRDPATRRYDAVGVLSRTDDVYRFRYLDSVSDLPGFRPFVGFPRVDAVYESPSLFPLFSERLLEASRPDRQLFLGALALPDYASAMEFLARSGGRRAGDTIELLPIPAHEAGRTEATFLVHGVRHLAGASEAIDRLSSGQILNLEPEPSNPQDSDAVLVTDDGIRLGYVPNPLLGYVRAVMETGDCTVMVVRANPPEAGHHLRLLVRLAGAWPTGYVSPW